MRSIIHFPLAVDDEKVRLLLKLVQMKLEHQNIHAEIHSYATRIASEFLMDEVKRAGGIVLDAPIINDRPSRGPDILFKFEDSSGLQLTWRAEVSCNFSYAQGPEAGDLYEDVVNLRECDADRKVLVVLSRDLAVQAKNRCKRRRTVQPIDVDSERIEVVGLIGDIVRLEGSVPTSLKEAVREVVSVITASGGDVAI